MTLNASFARLPARSFLRITGSHATHWLNSIVTNSIDTLQVGEGSHNSLVDAQSQIQGDFAIFREPDGTSPAFVLAATRRQLGTIRPILDASISTNDVLLASMDYYDYTLLLFGPDAPTLLRKIEAPHLTYEESFADLPPMRLRYYGLTANQIITSLRGNLPAFEISTSHEQEFLVEEALTAGANEISAENVETFHHDLYSWERSGRG